MTEWKKYIGSDEQVKEIREATPKVLIRVDGGACKEISGIHLEFYVEELKEYLICNPHPYADMICQWARTGQPVWWRNLNNHRVFGKCDQLFKPFDNPSALEYSFTEFKEEL